MNVARQRTAEAEPIGAGLLLVDAPRPLEAALELLRSSVARATECRPRRHVAGEWSNDSTRSSARVSTSNGPSRTAARPSHGVHRRSTRPPACAAEATASQSSSRLRGATMAATRVAFSCEWRSLTSVALLGRNSRPNPAHPLASAEGKRDFPRRLGDRREGHIGTPATRLSEGEPARPARGEERLRNDEPGQLQPVPLDPDRAARRARRRPAHRRAMRAAVAAADGAVAIRTAAVSGTGRRSSRGAHPDDLDLAGLLTW